MTSDYNKFGANNVYNETFEADSTVPNQEKRLQIAVSGPGAISGSGNTNSFADNDDNEGINFIDLAGHRPDVVEEPDAGDLGEESNWSDPATWTFVPPRIPMDGDDITISAI